MECMTASRVPGLARIISCGRNAANHWCAELVASCATALRAAAVRYAVSCWNRLPWNITEPYNSLTGSTGTAGRAV
jgi:hypothetical protein